MGPHLNGPPCGGPSRVSIFHLNGPPSEWAPWREKKRRAKRAAKNFRVLKGWNKGNLGNPDIFHLNGPPGGGPSRVSNFHLNGPPSEWAPLAGIFTLVWGVHLNGPAHSDGEGVYCAPKIYLHFWALRAGKHMYKISRRCAPETHVKNLRRCAPKHMESLELEMTTHPLIKNSRISKNL